MLEPADQQYVCIGRVARSHGIEGTVLVIPEIDAPALFDDINLVRLKNDRGDLIPARVQSVRVQEKNNRLTFFVKFDHISDRNQADAIRDISIFVPQQKIVHLLDDTSEAALISFDVIDQNGKRIGTVAEVMGNPAHLILAVQTKDGRLLIPFVDEYVTATDEGKQTIHCRNIDQLIVE